MSGMDSHPRMLMLLTSGSGGAPSFYYSAASAARALSTLQGWGYVTDEGTKRLPDGSWPLAYGRFTVLFEDERGLDLTGLTLHATKPLRGMLDRWGEPFYSLSRLRGWTDEKRVELVRAEQRRLRGELTSAIETAITEHTA